MEEIFQGIIKVLWQIIVPLVGFFLILDLLGGRKVLRNIVHLYRQHKEPFDKENATLIFENTGIHPDFIKTLYRLYYRNPHLQGERLVSFTFPLTASEMKMVSLLVYNNGYSVRSLQMPEGTHEHKRTPHTFTIENQPNDEERTME